MNDDSKNPWRNGAYMKKSIPVCELTESQIGHSYTVSLLIAVILPIEVRDRFGELV